MIKILNLYAGIGGNRKLWKDVEVTAVENNPEIAKIYQDFFPNDKVIVGDAHQYLLENYKEFDFIWSSPPCPTHSRMRKCFAFSKDEGRKRDLEYPDMKLYQEIIILKTFFKGKFVVENVEPYYIPLITPQKSGRHCFWTNFIISDIIIKSSSIEKGRVIDKEKELGIKLSDKNNLGYRRDQLLNNCVHPRLGLHIFNMAFKEKQEMLQL